MAEENPEQKQAAVISIHFKTKDQLYRAYMPFIKGGGLFIPTPKDYAMGDPIKLLLKIMDEPEQFNIETTIIWISPQGAQDGRKAGIGVQLSGEIGEQVRGKIDTYLAGLRNSSDKTETM